MDKAALFNWLKKNKSTPAPYKGELLTNKQTGETGRVHISYQKDQDKMLEEYFKMMQDEDEMSTKKAFEIGFLKAAENNGFEKQQALRLAKEAGLFGDIGNFAKDMFWEPAKGIFTNGADAFKHLSKGRFGDAFSSGAKAVGNAGLTALNFVPGAGLGSMAVRGGLRAGGALARGGGRLLSSVGNRVAVNAAAPAATAVQTAAKVAPRAARAVKPAVAQPAGFTASGPVTAPRVPKGKAPAPAPAVQPPFRNQLSTGLQNMGQRFQSAGNAMTNSVPTFNNATQRIGNTMMSGIDSASARLGAEAKNIYGGLKAKLLRQPVPALQSPAPGATPISGFFGRNRLAANIVPGLAGGMGASHYSGLREERQRIQDYMTQPGLHPYSDYELLQNRDY